MNNSAPPVGIIESVSSKNSGKTSVNPILFTEDAVQVALEALGEIADSSDAIGEHLAAIVEGDLVVHRFRCHMAGYPDWEWVAVLASVPGTRAITINEVGLQAGKKATRAPEWVPYEDRVLPGDLGPGDTLPPRHDDERLSSWRELTTNGGFPRNPEAAQTLSERGLKETVQRWRTGEYGPNSEFAEQASMMCRTCAFYLPFNSVETNFGACTNEFSADGHVVHATFGCGAHSATKEQSESAASPVPYGAFDDEGIQRFS
ncbi:DUF3027 domain-containing protein [Corynebacterium sp. DSM 45110]|uniref:DUF3027 domain-containing protein n=1 Tax=Corynebacterium suicordis DSM 45110 TaxID=1121369 RepID=A0ABR9ZL05_9CORY|nr:DUF3027 domain-containing protein [Corynebacterium suicordis DSM 45110]